jgi:hypothetical protein
MRWLVFKIEYMHRKLFSREIAIVHFQTGSNFISYTHMVDPTRGIKQVNKFNMRIKDIINQYCEYTYIMIIFPYMIFSSFFDIFMVQQVQKGRYSLYLNIS